jgi:hypothetical protein
MYYICRHIMPSGCRCHAPALSGTHFCYFHTRLHCKPDDHTSKFEQALTIPVLESRTAIQLALSQVLNAFGSKKLDTRQAYTLLYGLRIASQNFGRANDILSSGSVQSVTSSEEGDDLAPEKHICQQNDDCNTCPHSETCELCVEADDEEEEDEEEE